MIGVIILEEKEFTEEEMSSGNVRTCGHCGQKENQTSSYMGAYTCSYCGGMTNAFGQTLKPISEWEEDY